MEEGFKKRREDDGGVVEIAEEGEILGMEGVREVLEGFLDEGVGVLKEGYAVKGVLDYGCEDVLEGNPSCWSVVIGEKVEKRLDSLGDGGLEEVVCAEEEVLGGGGPIVGVKEGASGRVGSVKAAVALNWKQAVVGGGECIKAGCNGVGSGGKVLRGDGAARGDAYDRSGAVEGGRAKSKGIGGGPVKVCREIVFGEQGGGFLDSDGETMNVDRSKVLECEKSLERALVWRILGRQVPFGFFHRELRKKWGKFGRAHLSLAGGNSFVFFLFEGD